MVSVQSRRGAPRFRDGSLRKEALLRFQCNSGYITSVVTTHSKTRKPQQSLVSIQVITSIIVYLPAAKLAVRVGRKPLVIFTFVSFTLFPLLIIAASGFAALVLAFIIGGLREIGEPARKAMIVDFAEDGVRARSVGLYYLVRSLSITPAAAIGGLLWNVAPELPFVVAALVGIAGTLVFAMTVEERYAS